MTRVPNLHLEIFIAANLTPRWEKLSCEAPVFSYEPSTCRVQTLQFHRVKNRKHPDLSVTKKRPVGSFHSDRPERSCRFEDPPQSAAHRSFITESVQTLMTLNTQSSPEMPVYGSNGPFT